MNYKTIVAMLIAFFTATTSLQGDYASKTEKSVELSHTKSCGHLTRSGGVYYYNGHKETWYSTNEAGGKTTAVPIPGKHVADDGTIRDEDGYICVASSDLKMYSIVMTSVGPGKVYDTGCSHGTIDVYTNW